MAVGTLLDEMTAADGIPRKINRLRNPSACPCEASLDRFWEHMLCIDGQFLIDEQQKLLFIHLLERFDRIAHDNPQPEISDLTPIDRPYPNSYRTALT